MSYQDRYKGRKIKDPPSSLGRFGLFIVVGAAFAAFVGTLRGLDSSLCALATLTMVALKLAFELVQTMTRYKLPERIINLPVALWLLFWLIPVPPMWFLLRRYWPKDADPNGAIGVLTLLCLGLYIPTIMAVLAPPKKAEEAGKEEEKATSFVPSEKETSVSDDGTGDGTINIKSKRKSKGKRKGKS